MLQVIDFWQAQGVDGFRFDVINFLSTRGIGPDNPEKAGVQQHEHDVNQPGLIGTLQRVCQHARQQGDVFLIGEIGSEERETLARYQAPSLMDVVFNFNIGSQKTFDAARLCDEINATLALQSGLPTLFFSSHDMPRMISRFGEGPHDAARALAVLALQLTVRGVPFIFQGDELGMPDYVPQTVGQIFDIQEKPSTTRPCGRGAVPPTRWRRPLNIHGMGPVPLPLVRRTVCGLFHLHAVDARQPGLSLAQCRTSDIDARLVVASVPDLHCASGRHRGATAWGVQPTEAP
jgi:glycosidase